MPLQMGKLPEKIAAWSFPHTHEISTMWPHDCLNTDNSSWHASVDGEMSWGSIARERKVTANLRLLREELVFPRDEPPKWLSNTILKHACLQATIYTYKKHLKDSASYINTYK